MNFRTVLGLAFLGCAQLSLRPAPANSYFGIEVVDDQTGRGVPMVELSTTTGTAYYTDSNGLMAFNEPGLMDKKVWFGVSAHGYEYKADGFGNRGVALETQPGRVTQLKIKRLNIAERLYRITGYGIYRDTVLLGRKPPVAEPLLNSEVTGLDGVLTAIYNGKLYWFYGDTTRLSYALGNFAMTGATTDLPERLDPERGFALHYFQAKDGFVKHMAPIKGEGVVWLFGLVVLPDDKGKDQMLAYFQRRRGMEAVLENGFVLYNPKSEVFEKVKDVALEPAWFPQLYPSHVKEAGTDYVYFCNPYPTLRVRANAAAYLDLNSYEGYTCLVAGTKLVDKDHVQLERNASGALVWGWKRATPTLTAKEQEALVQAGKMKAEESPLRLADVETGKPVLLNGASCFWNAYRKRYVLIASEVFGATMLGEVWYSEADHPEGPWTKARKIITHANKKGDAHDFYNPTQHPFFDQEGGRIIYLEGSYVNTFSGNPHTTPYYEYNQIMYRLDLADPRLRL